MYGVDYPETFAPMAQMYAVGIVNQFMHNPKEVYLRAMVQILQHLKGTPGKGILFRKGEKNVFRSLYRHRLCKFSSR